METSARRMPATVLSAVMTARDECTERMPVIARCVVTPAPGCCARLLRPQIRQRADKRHDALDRTHGHDQHLTVDECSVAVGRELTLNPWTVDDDHVALDFVRGGVDVVELGRLGTLRLVRDAPHVDESAASDELDAPAQDVPV